MATMLMTLIARPFYNRSVQYYLRCQSVGGVLREKSTFLHNYTPNCTVKLCQQKLYSTSSEKPQDKALQEQQSELSENVRPMTFKTVKETTKTASYLGVILIGVGVTGFIFYNVFSELFSSKSPNNIYSKALELISSDARIQDALGQPISGYGEENRRGRRQHVSHLHYEKDGERRLRMKFYISGSRKRATVHLEMKEDESGNFVYRYLFVELDDFGRHPIVLEDNRHSDTRIPASSDKSQFEPFTSEEYDLSKPLNMNLNFPDAGLK